MQSFNAHGVKVKTSGNHVPQVTHHGVSDGPEIKEGNQIEEIEDAEDIPENGDDSQFVLVGASDGPEIKEGNQIEEIEGAEVILANDDDSHTKEIEGAEDSPANHNDSPTFQFNHCNVHINLNSFNTRGVNVKNSGNNAPRVTHHGGAALNEDPSSSSILSWPKGPRNLAAPTTLPQAGPESQPHPINPSPPIHMGLHPTFLSHILQSFPDNNTANDLPSLTNLHPHHYLATPNSSRHCPLADTNSKSLEHHLNSALEILIQTSGISTDGVTPQARNTLKAINALVSMETL